LVAHAEGQPSHESQAALVEIVVTGTRILRTDGESSAASVTLIDARNLIGQGDRSLGDALNDLPALRATWGQANSSRFIGTAGMNWLDLRGLGPERTLVLVNNRRHVTSSPGDNYVDVNSIPSELVERVDIVTGGDSAVYGSDAVAGVVNFVLRREFEGLRFRAQAGQSSQGDRSSKYLSLTAGRNVADGRGNGVLAVEWNSADALYFRQRESLTGSRRGRRLFALSEDPSDDPGGSDGIPDYRFYNGGLYDSTMAVGGVVHGNAADDTRIFSFDAAGRLVESIPAIDLRPFGSPLVRLDANPGGLATYAETGQLAPGLERLIVNALAHFDVSDGFRPFLEAKLSRVDVIQTGGPSFWRGSIPAFFTRIDTGSGAGTDLKCSNPFLSTQALGVMRQLSLCATLSDSFEMSRLNVDFGPRSELHDRDTYRVVVGAEGNLRASWRYEVALNYGRLDTRMRSLNNLVTYDLQGRPDGFLLAVDAVRNPAGEIVCGINADADPANDRPDCVPIDVFGPGVPSQAALNFVNTTGTRKEQAEQFVVSAYLTGELPQLVFAAGRPTVAIGAEYRHERAWSVYDQLSASGGTFQNAIQPFRPPDLSIEEAFAELRVPLLFEKPLARQLNLEAAWRISSYDNSSDSVSAWNAGLVYAPASALLLHANYSTSVRAPTQADRYRPFSQDFARINDPCDALFIGDEITHPYRAVNCAAAGLAPGFVNTPARSGSTGFVQGGNPLLVEEEGESLTIGGRFTAPWLPGLSLAADYFDIEVTHLIVPANAQQILNACYDSQSGLDSPFCSTIRRLPNGEFAPVALVASAYNYARQVTKGIDADITYFHGFRNGQQLSMRLLATRVFELTNYVDLENPRLADRQLSELGNPELAFNLDLEYVIGNFSVSYGLRHAGPQTIGFYEEQHSFDGRPPTDADIYPRRNYPSSTIHSIRCELDLGERPLLFVGVNNLTDSRPPLGLLGDAPGESFDSVGRYFYVGFTFGR
jgi:outer membrane receptor protein involved in Fe transport